MMEKHLQVHWWDGSVVGHLIHRGAIYFVYDEAWIRRGHNLSPLSLPFTNVVFNGSKGIDGLPGLIADCLPDSWGRKVARKEFARNKWGEPTSMTLLAWRGTRGLGALRFLPPLQEGSGAGRLETISAAALARGAAEIERGEPTEVLAQLAQGGTAGGAYPKAVVLAYPDGTLSVGSPDGLGDPCLLKFDLSEGGDNAPCEHAYALMARAAGIRAVQTRLIEENPPAKRRHLLVKRFDLPDLKKPERRFHFHSASGLLHKGAGDLDYRDLFRAAIRLNTQPGELRELARRMVFNVLSSNHDDHGKNHAFLYHEERREWSLAPAYDMTYSSGMLERGTLVNGEVWPTIAIMESLCLDAGVTKAEFRQLFEKVKNALDQWNDFAKQSGLSAAKAREIRERHLLIQNRVLI
ncbi:MAG: type II toxin-antitoxin system HipA family toxin [Methylacidiphilales bacterium]|nr:type II toxin-antitoxin system HipA family toxin [Candidatus Methylacidiphilales bacterium]